MNGCPKSGLVQLIAGFGKGGGSMQNEIEYDANKIIRGAFCNKHNLHYDSSRKGCVMCRRERSSKIILLIALVICLALVMVMVRPVLYPDESPIVSPSPAAEDASMDPLGLL